jgi:DNA-binding MarR family transcriptional regulator
MNDELYRKLPSLFFTARQLMRSRVRSAGKSDPYNWMRLETLRFISANGGATMHDVAGYLRITAPSATSLVRGLMRRGFLVRKAGKADKRIVFLSLSPKGKKLLDTYVKQSAGIMHEVFSRLGVHDVRELARILQLLQDQHHE